MKKFTLVIAVALLSVLAVGAGPKLDRQGQKMAKEYAAKKPVKSVDGKEITSTLTVVTFTDASVLGELEAMGATVRDRRNGMAIVEMPVGILEKASELAKVKFVSTPKKVKALNDKARAKSKVDLVRAGIPNPENPSEIRYFDGTGVVTGLMDTGLDPNHIMFKNSDGTSRVKGISVFSGSQGDVTRYSSASDIASFTTENEEETHGTHVLGMMAGSYTGGDSDWSGVATGSDIYVCCGDLYDYNILLGIIEVCDYAESVGKPAVVNLSLGGNDGPHDEYDTMSQYIDQIVSGYTPCPIVCIAAGNEGEDGIAIIRDFTASSSSFKTTLNYFYTNYRYIIGSVEFYSDDNTPFTVTPFIYDSSNRSIVKTLTSLKLDGSTSGTVAPSYSSLGISTYFNNYGTPFEGSVGLTNGSNRFSAVYDCYTVAKSSNYRLGFSVEGTPGHKIYCYQNSSYGTTYFSDSNNSSFIGDSGGDGSFNSMACGRRTIAVGSYNSNDNWWTIDGHNYGYSGAGFGIDELSGFSSWGTLWDGREMPHFVAPGCVIASSVSTYNVNSTSEPFDTSYLVRQITASGRDHHWGMMQGTSMATPHACGIMALWKQLVPDLEVEDALAVAQETAENDQYTGVVKAGAGKINAYAGLLKLMESTSVEGNIANKVPTVLVVRNADGSYSLSAAEGADFIAKVYSLSGAEVASTSSISGKATIDATRLQKGIYLISVNGARISHAQKIVVK